MRADAKQPDPATAKTAVKLRMAVGFGALLLQSALLVFGFTTSARATEEWRQAHHWHQHTLNVLIITGELKNSITTAIRGERGYLLTGQRLFLEPYERGTAASRTHFGRLGGATSDNPRQRQNLARLKSDLDRYLAVLAQTVRLQEQGRHAEAVAIVRQGIGRSRIEAVLSSLQTMEKEERRLLQVRSEALERSWERSQSIDRLLMTCAAILVTLVAIVGMAAAGASHRAEEAVRELRRLATTDVLTGLVNRRRFFALLEAEVERADRDRRPLSVAMLDIDHFKRINDTHGHPAGDTVLQAVASTLANTTRSGDVVARIGGEEFAVLMPDTGERDARLASERLRKAIERQEVPIAGGKSLSVTLSTGIALLADHEQTGQLVSRADSALYDAKMSGRNQVRMAA